MYRDSADRKTRCRWKDNTGGTDSTVCISIVDLSWSEPALCVSSKNAVSLHGPMNSSYHLKLLAYSLKSLCVAGKQYEIARNGTCFNRISMMYDIFARSTAACVQSGVWSRGGGRVIERFLDTQQCAKQPFTKGVTFIPEWLNRFYVDFLSSNSGSHAVVFVKDCSKKCRRQNAHMFIMHCYPSFSGSLLFVESTKQIDT